MEGMEEESLQSVNALYGLLLAVLSLLLGSAVGLYMSPAFAAQYEDNPKSSKDSKVRAPTMLSTVTTSSSSSTTVEVTSVPSSPVARTSFRSQQASSSSAKLNSALREVMGSPRRRVASSASSTEQVCESVNTVFDISEFIIRMFKTGFVVHRVKGSEVHSRCLKLDKTGSLCVFKKFSGTDIIQAQGSPYLVLPIADLNDCFSCDDKKSFVLEFKQKTLLLRTDLPVDCHYLEQGFQHLREEVQNDSEFVQKTISQQKQATSLQILSSPERKKQVVASTPSRASQGPPPTPKSNFSISSSRNPPAHASPRSP